MFDNTKLMQSICSGIITIYIDSSQRYEMFFIQVKYHLYTRSVLSLSLVNIIYSNYFYAFISSSWLFLQLPTVTFSHSQSHTHTEIYYCITVRRRRCYLGPLQPLVSIYTASTHKCTAARTPKWTYIIFVSK